MLRRLLIANRGEIACRILGTARRLGLTGIAVYSDADRDARHVRLADEAYRLGASPAAQSYLDAGRILELARRVGADAIHPGYGFLSENPGFAELCAQAGIRFVGPPAAAIRAMGSKSDSKDLMLRAGVPVAPGYQGEDQSVERLRAEAELIGLPLIIKASAGGGGKGMQVVHSLAELAPALESARRLARAAFADDRLLLERYFSRARHVEVQLFADSHGGVVTLFDRDCSVQRRHQKIVEEAPAPGLRAPVRGAMAAAAVAAARAVGYVGAGTVEFLVDPEQRFYFMEMNTRLQVEHPVTEYITGIDLVEWQLRIADGEPLPLAQEAIEARGAALEVRLYAEDPARGYLPSVGRIGHLRWPAAAGDLRIDSGVDAGDPISDFYDPLLAKLIAWGPSRPAAIARLRRALGELESSGPITNQALLASVLADEEFGRGPVSTDFLERRAGHLAFADGPAEHEDLALAAVWQASEAATPQDLWSGSTGWRLGAPARSLRRYGEHAVWVEADAEAGDEWRAGLGERQIALRRVRRSHDGLEAEIDGRRECVRIVAAGDGLTLFRRGRRVDLRAWRIEDALSGGPGGDEGSLATPLPGTVVALHVAVGEIVARGAPLATIEAMKMEHTLTAPHAGRIGRLVFATGDRVTAGAVLVEMEVLEIAGVGSQPA